LCRYRRKRRETASRNILAQPEEAPVNDAEPNTNPDVTQHRVENQSCLDNKIGKNFEEDINSRLMKKVDFVLF
jgi:hypothetical protein